MRTRFGQYYTFEVETSDDRFSGFTYHSVQEGARTVKSICKQRHISDARYVADLNDIRSVESKLRLGRQVRVPARATERLAFNVLAGDEGPRVTAGYGKITTVDRSERTGLSIFTGYDPAKLELPLRFENLDPSEDVFSHADGFDVERRIALLERMAGRGQFAGAAVGQPSVVRVSTTGNRDDDIVPLIPLAFQRYSDNPNGPVWWISDIDWGSDALRNHRGERIRQLATVSLTQFVAPRLGPSSASDRNKAKRKPSRGTATYDPNRPNIASGVGQTP